MCFVVYHLDTHVTRTLEPTTRDLEDIVEVMLGEVDDGE